MPLFCIVAAWPKAIQQHTETHFCFAMCRFVAVSFLIVIELFITLSSACTDHRCLCATGSLSCFSPGCLIKPSTNHWL
jgi:hypothetical protein